MTLYDSRIRSIPNKSSAKNIWIVEEDNWLFVISEHDDGYFYVYHHKGYWDDDKLWFVSYNSARHYLRKEFYLKSRMKKLVLN